MAISRGTIRAARVIVADDAAASGAIGSGPRRSRFAR